MCANTVSVRSKPKIRKNFRLMNAEDETLSDYGEEDRDGIVRHEKETKLNGYDNEGYHCQERSEDDEESASDDDRLRVVVTENGHRPEDDSHMSNGYVHDETNGHSTTVNGSAVIVIEENKSNSNMNDNKEDTSSPKPLDTRLHHYVPVDDIDRKILNGSDGTHVTIPEDAVINFTTGRVKVKKGSSNNSQVSSERESIPLETMLPSYEAEDKIGLGEKAELEAELTNHKNGLWSEGHNTYSNAESPFGNSEKLNGTSKSSDEISLPVNNHRKCLSSDVSDTSSEQKSTGEKLYFTEENRKLCPGWRRVFVCGLILIIIAVALLLGVLAATGILLAESESKNSRYESGHSLPNSDFISSAGHSYNRPRPPFKVPQKSLSQEGTNTTDDPVSRTFSPAVSSKVPVLNDSSHSQTIVPNALVGEFTIDENFTDDLKDNSSNGYQSLAKYIERELHGIFKRNGGIFEALKILSFSPGSIKIKFVTIWASDRSVILSTKAEEIFKSFLRKNRNSLLAYPVDLDSVHFIDVFDECRVQKGGCSFNCIWDYNTVSKTCACGENMILLADGKSCGPKPSTSALETTTAKSVNTSTITTDQPLIKEPPETTKGQDKAIPTTTVIPTIVTKAIISITELFHNLTSTEISAYVTESTTHLKNLSTIVSEYSPSDFRTSTKSYTPEEPTTERTANTIHIPEILNETTTEITTITENPVNENTENDDIFKRSNITDASIHSNASATTLPSTSEHEAILTSTPKSEATSTTAENETTSTSISEHETTLTSISEHETTLTSISEHETTTSSLVVNMNDSVNFSEQPISIADNTDSHSETTTNLPPLTELATTQQDLTTIGYHIKEETTEMYTFEDNTKFEINPEFDTTTEEPAASITDVEVTTNHFFPSLITEIPTTEMTHSPALDLSKNSSEVIELNTIDITNVSHATNASDTIDATTITEDLQTDAMNSEDENVTGTTEFISVTETSNEEFLNNNLTNFTSPGDILNETNFKDPDAVDPFATTTFEPLTTATHSNRSPEVRSFEEDDENVTTTQNINLNSTHNFTNDFSPETDKQNDKNDTVLILDSITTSTTSEPTTETSTETSTEITLFESTTEKSEIYETTTHFVPPENKPLTSTEKILIETTVIPKNISEDAETTVNMGETSALTTESSHINKSPDAMNGMLDTTTTVLESESTTIASTESEITTVLPIETETPNTIIGISNSTEADNATLENNTEMNTSLTPDDALENGTTHTSNDSETIEHLHYGEENITSSYNESTIPDILEATLPNTESNIHTIIVENSTDEKIFNSSTALNNTSDEFLLATTLEPTNISDELTTLEDVNTLDDSDLTSLETSNFSISNTELPSNVTPTLSSDSNETLTLDTVPDYTLPTPPYPNGSEIEVTTESIYGTEATFTFAEYDNETFFPFDMDSNFTNTTNMPFESSFLEINSTLIAGSNESLENSTYFGEFDNFTTESYDAANETTTNASTGIECREDQFLCEPLNKCINDTFMCDGIQDCPDGSDEFQCKDTCHSNFRCANSSTCIMSEARCDGIWDCENGTDEENCTPTECAQHEVMCLDHSKCIKPGHICDWKYNCLDRSDEVGCVERTTCESNGRFFCNDGLCIPWSLKCDGEHDCKEGEDEGNCTCLSDEFQCNDGKCLKSSSRCDGHQDCHDADDEMGCVTVDNQHIVSTYEPYSGTWGLLCAEDWNPDDGQYLCQELGFGHALNIERVHVSFNGTWMAMRRENLTESSLWTERVAFVESCTSGLAATVECQKFNCGEYTSILHRRRRDVVSSSSSQWPFIGYTSTFQSNKGCLSEILTPIWLITSAECLLSISKQPFNGSDWYVRTNIGRDVEADVAQNHEVLRIINHPHSSKFRSLTLRDYDVALVRLKHALVFVSDKIGAICPPEEQVPPGITCFSGVLGTEKPRAPPPPVLTINSLALQIIDRRNCNRVEHFNNAINQRMLCTQSSEGHTICDNDEGTPLICLSGINNYFLAGMLTYQRFCDVYSKHPAVFSNLFSMRKFLDQVTGQKQYEVSYDSGMYVIVPPTTPSPTMPETTTPEMTTLGTTEFSLTNTTYLTTVEFENGTESIFDNLEEFNATTEMNEELAREELYTTVLPEELMGLLSNTTLRDNYWNETVTIPYEMDADVLNATLGELEKSEDEVSENKTHDDMTTLLNDTYSRDDTANYTTISDVNIEFSNVTASSIPEITTDSLESANISTILELNDSLITTTEFRTSDNETTNVTTELSAYIDTTNTATVQPSLISAMNDSEDNSKLTTSTVDLDNTTDLISVFNGTIEMFKPLTAHSNESKLISQPLIALIDDTKELENITTMSSLEALGNSTENTSIDTTLIEPRDYSHPLDIDSETTVASTVDITDFKRETPVETTTQPITEEAEAVTFIVEGEPDADLAFSLFKHPDGLKIESYRMLEDNEFTPKENISLPMKQDANVSVTTEGEVTLIPIVTTTIFPEHFTNETEKHVVVFDNLTDSFNTESINSTPVLSMNLTSEAEIKPDNANASVSSLSNMTEKHDLMSETMKDVIIPKSENLVNNNLSYSMPLTYEDDFTFDIINKSSLFSSNETERHDIKFYNITEKTVPKSAGLILGDMNFSLPIASEDNPKPDIENTSSLFFHGDTDNHDLIFYNITEKTIPKSAGLIMDHMNFSVPLTFKDNPKSDIENVSSLFFLNDTNNHDLIFYNITDKTIPKLIDPIKDSMNDPDPLALKDGSKSNIDDISVFPSGIIEKTVSELYNESSEFIPRSFDSIMEDVNYSTPFTFKDDTKTDNVNTSLLSLDNVTENHAFNFDNKTEDFVPKSEGPIMDNINYSMPLTLESGNTNTSSLHPHNLTENHDLEFDNKSENFAARSEDPIMDDMNYSMHLILESGNINTSSLHPHNLTENHGLEFDNMSEDFVPKSEGPIIDDMNYSNPLTLESGNTNTSSLHPHNLTENHDLEFENSEDFAPKSEGPIMDDMNYSMPLTLESGNANTSSLHPHNLTENHDLEFENSEDFVPKSEGPIMDDMNYSMPLTLESGNANTSSLHPHNLTEKHDLEFDNKSEDFVTKSEGPIMDDINYSMSLTLESGNANTSSLHPHNLTENHDLEFDKSEEFVPKSEGPLTDDVIQPIPLVVESDNTNASSLSNTFNMTEEHGLVTENMTEKIIPKSVGSIIDSTINYSLPLLFDEDGRSSIVNESSVEGEYNKAITGFLEPELDAGSLEDSIMKMHLTSEELNVLPENDTASNISSCGIWAENPGTMTFDNQNPFKLWPAVGYLEMISESKRCPSTVISPKYVITSLDCLISSNIDMDLNPDKWTYVGGLHNSDILSGTQTLTVNKIIPYPDKFLLLNEHDVALVKMNDVINMNEFSKTACVAQEKSRPGKNCFTAGWNKNFSDENIQSQFYSFPLTIISIEECNNTMNYNGMLIDNLLCGVRGKEKVQSCYMDFGSPLFCQNENKQWELHGILNRPDPCDTAKPIVFSDILSVGKWINESLTNDEIILDTN